MMKKFMISIQMLIMYIYNVNYPSFLLKNKN